MNERNYDGVIAAILLAAGATRENPVTFTMDELKEAVQGKVKPESRYDQEKREFTIYYV